MSDDKKFVNKPKIPFLDLWVKTSAKGTVYYSGFLGGLSIVGFAGQRADNGQEVIRLFVSEGSKPMPALENDNRPKRSAPTQKPSGDGFSLSAPPNSGRRGDFDDDMPF